MHVGRDEGPAKEEGDYTGFCPPRADGVLRMQLKDAALLNDTLHSRGAPAKQN